MSGNSSSISRNSNSSGITVTFEYLQVNNYFNYKFLPYYLYYQITEENLTYVSLFSSIGSNRSFFFYYYINHLRVFSITS